VRTAGDSEIISDFDVPSSQAVDLFEEFRRVDDHAIGDDAGATRKQDARGDKVQCVAFIAHHDGMAGIGPAVVSDDVVVIVREEIDEFALAFVSPLEADDGGMSGVGGWRGIAGGHGDSGEGKRTFYESRGGCGGFEGADPYSGINL
jgi:hypothetical protein